MFCIMFIGVVTGAKLFAVNCLWVGALNLWFENEITLKLPNTLLNGLFGIHPVCMLLVYVLCVGFLINYELCYTCVLKNFIYCKFYVQQTITHATLLCVLLALFLGGWWANQELGWGGWWSWDNVEIITWILFWVVTYETHLNRGVLWMQVRRICTVMFSVWALHCTVRWDLTNSVHSFLQNYDVTFIYWFIDVVLFFFFYDVGKIFVRKRYRHVFFNWFQSFIFLNVCFVVCLIEQVVAFNFQIFWLWWLLGLIGIVIVGCVYSFGRISWFIAMFDVLLFGAFAGRGFWSYSLLTFHSFIMCVFVLSYYDFSYDFFALYDVGANAVVCGNGFMYNVIWGCGFENFDVKPVIGVELLQFFEFHDFDGLFNFSIKGVRWGGVEIIPGILSLWGGCMDFWFYSCCIAVYVIVRNYCVGCGKFIISN